LPEQGLDKMRPLATSWPPLWRTAEANGTAQVFSHTSTPAERPGSIAAAMAVTSSSLSSIASCVSPMVTVEYETTLPRGSARAASSGRGETDRRWFAMHMLRGVHVVRRRSRDGAAA
jgi:hypothetical protein